MEKALKCADVALKCSHTPSFLFPGIKPQTSFYLGYKNEGGISNTEYPYICQIGFKKKNPVLLLLLFDNISIC